MLPWDGTAAIVRPRCRRTALPPSGDEATASHCSPAAPGWVQFPHIAAGDAGANPLVAVCVVGPSLRGANGRCIRTHDGVSLRPRFAYDPNIRRTSRPYAVSYRANGRSPMKQRCRWLLGTGLVLVTGRLLTVTACSKGPLPPPLAPIAVLQAPTNPTAAFAAPVKGCVIAGTIVYTGPPVKFMVINTSKASFPVRIGTEDIIVGPNGKLLNVVVYIKKGLPKKSGSPPKKLLGLWRFRGACRGLELPLDRGVGRRRWGTPEGRKEQRYRSGPTGDRRVAYRL